MHEELVPTSDEVETHRLSHDAEPDKSDPAHLISSECIKRSAQIRLHPSQPLDRDAARLVFAADPSRIAELIDELKQERIIDLAGAGFVAAGIVRKLHVPDAGQIAPDRR